MLQLIVALIIIGAILFLLRFLPIDETFKTVIRVIVIVVAAIYLLREFWPMTGLG
jgi:hypothetical protein